MYMKFAKASALFAGLLVAWASQGAPANKTPQGWMVCVVHGATCANKGPAFARYGFTGNWAEKQVKGPFDCLPEAFQDGQVTGDPFGTGAMEVDKWCEVGQ